jgi:two-component system nitrate/nitrite response regulator NarL
MTTGAASTRPQPPEPIGIVVAHADDGERATLARWLRADGRFNVLGEVADPEATVAAVLDLLPDVAFVDLALTAGPGGEVADGVAAIAAIRQEAPAVRNVAVTREDDDQAYAALAAGAMACYLWADPDPDPDPDPGATAADMAAGAARGEGALTPGWARRILDEVRWLSRDPGLVPAPELSPTEQEVLRRIASGATPAAIAQLHGVTVHLVNVHAGAAITKVWRYHDDARQLAQLRQQ